MQRKKVPSLKARYFPLSKISVPLARSMYEVYCQYYDNVSLDLFTKDMAEKKGVIVMSDKATKRVVGFSTIKVVDLEVKGKKARGVFSGDTILEKQYWGSRALHMRFFFWMALQKVLHPMTPLFWLLISKGYKTYLLLANSFPSASYYPNHEGRSPHFEPLVKSYCDTLFSGYYCEQRKVLDFGDGYTHLKSDVAGITEEMRTSNPKIDFFEKKNPEWRRGTELPCIGEVTFSLVLSYPLSLIKKIRNKKRSTKSVIKTETKNALERCEKTQQEQQANAA